MTTIKVVAKDDVRYLFRGTNRLLNMKVGQKTTLSVKEIYAMGSFYHRFFTECDKTTEVEMFNDDPEILFKQWTERNVLR